MINPAKRTSTIELSQIRKMFEVTNPWNQSHRVIMDAEILKEFFEDFSFAKVNPNA